VCVNQSKSTHQNVNGQPRNPASGSNRATANPVANGNVAANNEKRTVQQQNQTGVPTACPQRERANVETVTVTVRIKRVTATAKPQTSPVNDESAVHMNVTVLTENARITAKSTQRNRNRKRVNANCKPNKP